LLGAILLAGGVFYLRLVVAPAVSNTDGGAEAYFGSRRGAWAKWVGIATLVVLATGLFNFVMIVKTNQSLGGAYHASFGIVFLLSLVVFFLAAVLAGKSRLAAQFQKDMLRWLNFCVAILVVIVVLTSFMRSIPHEPKAGAPPLLIAPSNTPLSE
jgi:putative copper export protein